MASLQEEMARNIDVCDDVIVVDIRRGALRIPAEIREQLGRLPFRAPTPGNELARTKPVPVFKSTMSTT